MQIFIFIFEFHCADSCSHGNFQSGNADAVFYMDVFLSFLEMEIPLKTSLHFSLLSGGLDLRWGRIWETMQMYGKFGLFPLVVHWFRVN